MNKEPPNFIRMKCVIHRCTPRAVLMQMEDGNTHWVPRSVTLDGADINVNDEDISIEDWWLKRNDITY